MFSPKSHRISAVREAHAPGIQGASPYPDVFHAFFYACGKAGEFPAYVRCFSARARKERVFPDPDAESGAFSDKPLDPFSAGKFAASGHTACSFRAGQA